MFVGFLRRCFGLQLLQDLEDFAIGFGRLVFGLFLARIADQRAQMLCFELGILLQQFGQRGVVGEQFFSDDVNGMGDSPARMREGDCGCYFWRIADFGRNALHTASSVSTYGPPIKSMQ